MGRKTKGRNNLWKESDDLPGKFKMFRMKTAFEKDGQPAI